KFWKKYIGDLFLPQRFYIASGACILLFIVAFFFISFLPFTKLILAVFLALTLIDYIMLFFINRKPDAKRIITDRLSNGDNNKVQLRITNNFRFDTIMNVIYVLP